MHILTVVIAIALSMLLIYDLENTRRQAERGAEPEAEPEFQRHWSEDYVDSDDEEEIKNR